MTSFLIVVVSLAVSALGDNHAGRSAELDPSVKQIRDTLQNLLKSIEDEGRSAKVLADQRNQWCGTPLQAVAGEVAAAHASLSFMSTDLAEHEAAMEEVRGTESQVRADVALMAYTLNQTEQMLSARRRARDVEKKMNVTNTSLVQIYDQRAQSEFEADEQSLLVMADTKRHTLMSLQAELELAVPALSQLEERVAETHRAISDGQASVAAGQAFLDVLNNGCERTSKLEDVQMLARANLTSSIQMALEAVVQVGTAPRRIASGDAPEESVISFFQEKSQKEDREADEDLFAIFGGADTSAKIPLEATTDNRHAARKAHHHARAQEEASARKSAGTQQRIERLLAQLKATSRSKTGSPLQRDFCARDRTQNQLLLRLAQASVVQMAAEIDVHRDVEEQVSDDLKRLQDTSGAVEAVLKSAANGTSKEQTTLVGNAKNQALATKILAQVLAILSTAGAAPDVPDTQGQSVAAALVALRSARSTYEAQTTSSLAWRHEREDFAEAISRTGHAALAAFDHERVNLDVTRDSHASERNRNAASKSMYEAEVKDATEYLSKLAADCGSGVADRAEHERKAQTKVLRDAQRILSGRGLVESAAAPGLRGGGPPSRELSPMERAASEMGIAVDGN